MQNINTWIRKKNSEIKNQKMKKCMWTEKIYKKKEMIIE